MRIVWDGEEFVGFQGETELVKREEIPDHAISNDRYTAALLTGPGGYLFDEPVFMHTATAYELDEAGVIVIHDSEVCLLDGVNVYLYETAV